MQPNPEDYDYELDDALRAVVGLRAIIPPDAFTADILGTERVGHGTLIREDGIILTIGYLVTEAETVWVSLANGTTVPGHVLGYCQETGFGLVQALARVDLPVLPLGRSNAADIGMRVVIAGAGGIKHAVASRIIAKQEFAGYWEYVLDEAIFVSPAHPFWGGTAVIGPAGDLIGVGSLQIQQAVTSRQGRGTQKGEDANMIVPIDLLEPIFNDLVTIGRPNRPARPWLGLYATEIGDGVAVVGVANGGPANKADVRSGDVIVAVDGEPVDDLAGMFRSVWALGEAGVVVPLTINREGRTFDLAIRSTDRRRLLKGPVLH